MPRDLQRAKLSQMRTLLAKQPKGALVNDVRTVALKLYKGLGTPLSLKLHQALLVGDIDTIANASVNPRDYNCPHTFYYDACAASLLKKFEGLANLGESVSLDPKQAAINSFYECELKNKLTNERLDLFLAGKLIPDATYVINALHDAREILSKLLGPCPSIESLKIRFGPGSTSACRGESVTIADKLSAFPETTIDGLPFTKVVKSHRAWAFLLKTAHPRCFVGTKYVTDDYGDSIITDFGALAPKIVRGNRFITVPKNAKTDRGICIEPHLLSCVQLAIGTHLTAVLKRAGLDKDVQQFVNAKYAELGSRSGDLATIDLQSASDTISYSLVKLLMPEPWLDFLTMARSSETEIEGKWVELEKFSSMGNGFTFELETLIFYSLSRACSDLSQCEKEGVNVFGDDIIVHRRVVPFLLTVLDFCGFSVNIEKSFFTGDFRESCGQDFFNGVDVRPYFLKKDLAYVTDIVTLVNGIYRMGTKHGTHIDIDPRFLPAWLRAIRLLPPSIRLYGPPGYGDAWIIDVNNSRWQTRRKFGITEVRGLLPQLQYRSLSRYCSDTVYACALYGLDSPKGILLDDGTSKAVESRLPLRGDPLCYRFKWLTVVT